MPPVVSAWGCFPRGETCPLPRRSKGTASSCAAWHPDLAPAWRRPLNPAYATPALPHLYPRWQERTKNAAEVSPTGFVSRRICPSPIPWSPNPAPLLPAPHRLRRRVRSETCLKVVSHLSDCTRSVSSWAQHGIWLLARALRDATVMLGLEGSSLHDVGRRDPLTTRKYGAWHLGGDR